MNERKLVSAELKSDETEKCDDCSFFSHIARSYMTLRDDKTEKTHHNKIFKNCDEKEYAIQYDSCCLESVVNKRRIIETDHEYSTTKSSSGYFDCSDSNTVEIANQNFQSKHETAMDDERDSKCSLSFKTPSISVRDFCLLQENKEKEIGKSAQSIKYIPFIRDFDHVCTSGLSESKNYTLETTTKKYKNDKDILSSNFTCSSDGNISIAKQKIEVIKNTAPICESVAEHKSYSINYSHCKVDEITESGDVSKKMQNTITEGKRYDAKLFSFPEMEDSTSCIYAEENTYSQTTERKSLQKNKDDDSVAFLISSHVSNDDISKVVRDGKDKTKQEVKLTKKICESTFPIDLNESTIVENELKVMTGEHCIEHKNLLFRTDFTNSDASKHKVLKEETEEIMPIEIKIDLSTLIDFEHSDEAKPVCKTKAVENTSNVLHAKSQKPFTTDIVGSDDIPVEDKTNYETIENITAEHKNCSEDLHFNNPENFNLINILKLESEINRSSDTVQTKQTLDDSHYPSIPETGKSGVTMINKKERELASPEDWEIIQEVQIVQKGEKSENFEKHHKDEKSKKEISCNSNVDDIVANCNLKDTKNFEEGDSYTYFPKTISNSISRLINFGIFSSSNSSIPENKADDKKQTVQEIKYYNEITLPLEDSINKNEMLEVKNKYKPMIKDCENSSYSSYFTNFFAMGCKLRKKQLREVNRSFSKDEKQNISAFKDHINVPENGDKKKNSEPETTENASPVDKKHGERVFSVKKVDGFAHLNVAAQNNPKNITSFNNTASKNAFDIEELWCLKERRSAVATENTCDKIQQEDNQNAKSIHNYLSSGAFEIIDGDYEDKACKDFFHSSNVGCENTNEKCDRTKHTDTRETLVYKTNEIRYHDIKTLEDALNCFNLFPLVETLEISLEDVRRHRKSEKEHEMLFKDVDKQIQKLSFKFHPDRVQNKGGSEEKIENAHKLQAALNAIRTALNILNNAFLEDINTDHRYGFYTKLNLTLLANENEVKSHIYEVIFQIDLLSEIKQQKIIVKIQKFLAESQSCIQSYFGSNTCDFEKHRESALFHLKCCIKGCKKLQSELKVIENESKNENFDNIGCTIGKMATENNRTLTVLKNLKRIAKNSLAGSFQIFTTSETLDEYFMLPFVYYVNLILMCSVMIKDEASRFGISKLKPLCIDCKIYKINGISFIHPYFLVLAFIDNKQCKNLFNEYMSKEELKQEFDAYLACFNNYMIDIFKECDYTDNSVKNYLSEELKKCMNMMFDFQTKEKEISKYIEKIKKKTEEIDEKYEKIMKENEELSAMTKERLERSKKLSEQTSLALSET